MGCRAGWQRHRQYGEPFGLRRLEAQARCASSLRASPAPPSFLATGEKVTYYYAWRGGPRLSGAPGSPEFVQSYEKAHRERRVPDPSLFKSIIASYLASPEFGDLRARTKLDYRKQIAKIERAFGEDAVTMEFREWRDRQSHSPRQADYAWTVLMLLLAWGRGTGLTTYRPPGRMKPLYRADRSDKIWEDHHIADFMAVAPPSLQWALVLAADTGQRQGDLLVLPWSAYDGKWIEIKQAKTGRRVKVPVTSRLRAVLEAMPRTSPVILTNARGRPWQPNAFRKAWGAVTAKAGGPAFSRPQRNCRHTALRG